MNEQMARVLATANVQAAALQATRAQFALEAWKIIAANALAKGKIVNGVQEFDDEGAAVAAVRSADSLLVSLGFRVPTPN